MLQKIMLKSIFVLFLTSFFALQFFQCSVFGADKEIMTKEKATAVLRVLDSDIRVLSVELAPVDGLWEAFIDGRGGKGMVYIDFAKQNILIGNILNIETKTNLTKKKFDEINRIDTSLIPLDDALVMGNPDARHKVIVFGDPDCPYCLKLHQEMKQVIEKRKDIVFYLKMFPLQQIHPQAYEKSKTIVCEKSNEKAIKLLEDAYAKKEIPKPSCDTKVIDENIQLALKLGIISTPKLVFSDGRTVSGLIKAEELIKLIENR